jgi:hypothetical protein
MHTVYVFRTPDLVFSVSTNTSILEHVGEADQL